MDSLRGKVNGNTDPDAPDSQPPQAATTPPVE